MTHATDTAGPQKNGLGAAKADYPHLASAPARDCSCHATPQFIVSDWYQYPSLDHLTILRVIQSQCLVGPSLWRAVISVRHWEPLFTNILQCNIGNSLRVSYNSDVRSARGGPQQYSDYLKQGCPGLLLFLLGAVGYRDRHVTFECHSDYLSHMALSQRYYRNL